LEIFALIAVTIYCCVSLFMAIRLIRMARRTREIPELMIGLAFLTGGMFGYPFSVASSVLLGASKPVAANVTWVVAQAGMALAAFFVLLSWRHIFAREIPGGRALISGWAVLLVASTVGVIMTSGPVPGTPVIQGFGWFMLITQGGCYALIGWSSYSHARMLRKRCVLGLADPVIANRIWLWGLSNSSITFSYLYTMIATIMVRFGLPSIFDPSVIAGCGLAAACCITLAFLPPRAYVERVRAKFAVEAA